MTDSGPPTEPWRDLRGRPLTDLRISVTDRCNFRCGYCMPRTKARSFLPRSQIISFEEIERVARVFVAAGVRKLRLTGGEPLLRRDLPTLVGMLRPLGAELALTTNAVLLSDFAPALKEAGLDRITVSLDALDPQVFQDAADAPGFSPQDVLSGIAAAESAGFSSLNINCVVRRGLNDQQILPLARAFRGSRHILRFIEFMDVGTRNAWSLDQVFSEKEILRELSTMGELTPLQPRHPGEVSRRYRLDDGVTEYGVIASVTRPFCGDCCRARLSADGRLYSCLFAQQGLSIFDQLRADVSDTDLKKMMAGWWHARDDRYSETRGELDGGERRHLPLAGQRVEMSYIGG